MMKTSDYLNAIAATRQRCLKRVGCFAEPSVLTVTGRAVSILDPDPSTIVLEDIAVGLSNTCRFGGQTQKHYSVAEHSVACAEDAYRQGQRPSVCLSVLFHDASEAYLGDIIRPLKTMLGEAYSSLEDRMTDAIVKRFDLVDGDDIHAIIKVHDNAICEQEMMIIAPETYDRVGESFREPLCGYMADWFQPSFDEAGYAAEKFKQAYSRFMRDYFLNEKVTTVD